MVTDADLLATLGRERHTPTSRLFFSRKNFEALHAGIRGLVYRQTGIAIGRQSDTELQILMRAIHDMYSRRSPHVEDALQDVRELNRLVLDAAVEDISTNLAAHRHYVDQLDRAPVPLEYSAAST